MFFGKNKKNNEINQTLPDKRAVKTTAPFGDSSFSKIDFMTVDEQKILSFLKKNLANQYTIFPKIRLLEFARPCGSDEVVKQLILNMQNITCDFLIAKNSFDIVAVIQYLPNNSMTDTQEKKQLNLKKVCEVISVDFTVIGSVSDAFSNEILASYLSDDEETETA